jgi:RNA polymerase sigma factor (sigma-70 family)
MLYQFEKRFQMNDVKTKVQFTDAEVILKILAGETALFEILIRRYNPVLYKTGRSYNYNHEDTQDLMQDTFIDAYAGLSRFEGRSSFKTWIIKIMLNNCFRKRRKFSFKNEITNEMEDRSISGFSDHMGTDANRTVLNRELSAIIEKALEGLPLDYRMVFSLRELNGMSVSEAAEILSLSEANVKVRLNRAKAMLRKEIEKSYTAQDIYEFNLIYCDGIVDKVMKSINPKNFP